jgi:hypothetical protein
MNLRLIIIFAVVLFVEIFFAAFFPNLTFVDRTLTISNSMIVTTAGCGLLFCSILLLRPKRWISVVAGIFFIAFLVSTLQSKISPIDTLTEPIDVATLSTYPDGRKVIIREFTNAKTNGVIRDTVLVKDMFIFRRIYKTSVDPTG